MELFQEGPVVWVQTTFGPGWEGTAATVSELGSSWGILIAAALGFWLWGRPALYMVLVVAAVEAVAKAALASVVVTDRPSGGAIVQYEIVEGVSSFPSGHVSTATVGWAGLSFLGLLPLWVPIAVGGAVALTRLYLGVHWLVDVVAGLLLGLATAWAVTRGRDRLMRELRRQTDAAWLVFGAVLAVGAAALAILGVPGGLYQWQGLGLLAGVAVALPVERRWVSFDPRDSGWPAATRLLLGGLGVGGFLIVHLLLPEDWAEVHGALICAATLWAVIGAPLLFREKK